MRTRTDSQGGLPRQWVSNPHLEGWLKHIARSPHPYAPSVWFSKPGVGPEKMHSWLSSQVMFCCRSWDHTLRTTNTTVASGSPGWSCFGDAEVPDALCVGLPPNLGASTCPPTPGQAVRRQPGFHSIFSLIAFEGQTCCRSNPEHPRASHLPHPWIQGHPLLASHLISGPASFYQLDKNP